MLIQTLPTSQQKYLSASVCRLLSVVKTLACSLKISSLFLIATLEIWMSLATLILAIDNYRRKRNFI